MSRKHGTVRNYLELLKLYTQKTGLTLEQVADFIDILQVMNSATAEAPSKEPETPLPLANEPKRIQ